LVALFKFREKRNRAKYAGVKLHSYLDANGKFDYEAYRRIQTEGNRRKIQHVWALEENIHFLSAYIKSRIGQPRFGLCHGTRRGLEQQWFSQSLGCPVIGTEISDTASQFANTIQWDFHDVKQEWLAAVDFIYSNSFDHSHDPPKCLDAWMSCLRPGGVCILEHTSCHTPEWVDELDPFGADLHEMPYLIARWGKGRYAVREILDGPVKPAITTYIAFLVIQHFPLWPAALAAEE
jgi:Methyltransferase domain